MRLLKLGKSALLLNYYMNLTLTRIHLLDYNFRKCMTCKINCSYEWYLFSGDFGYDLDSVSQPFFQFLSQCYFFHVSSEKST